jgi:hypothetical protein
MKTLLFIFLFFNFPLHAFVKYEQKITLSSWVSAEDIQKKALQICKAAQGDPDIKILDIQYRKKKIAGSIVYQAIFLCYVAAIDKDFQRVFEKSIQSKDE